MAYRNGNYCAFYVDEPFNSTRLGAFATRDFVYYQLLCAWKAQDRTFPFIDSHEKTYNVRDDSDWEKTLKPRLHERLRNSKNIILFLSNVTKNSKALHEELSYGVFDLHLPVVIVYPEFNDYGKMIYDKNFSQNVSNLWKRIPILGEVMKTVPVIHVPMSQDFIRSALEDINFCVGSRLNPGNYREYFR